MLRLHDACASRRTVRALAGLEGRDRAPPAGVRIGVGSPSAT
jgi:hypothetical protein